MNGKNCYQVDETPLVKDSEYAGMGFRGIFFLVYIKILVAGLQGQNK
jgi:hypothetical protein